jgi:hypothetical protein
MRSIESQRRSASSSRPRPTWRRPLAWRESLCVDLGIGWCGLGAFLPRNNRLACLPCPNYIEKREQLPLFHEQRRNLIELRMLGDRSLAADRNEEIAGAVEALDRRIVAMGGTPGQVPARATYKPLPEINLPQLSITFDTTTGSLLVEHLEVLPQDLRESFEYFIGPGEALGCACPIAALPVPPATNEEFAAQPSVRAAGYYHNSLIEGPGRRSVTWRQDGLHVLQANAGRAGETMFIRLVGGMLVPLLVLVAAPGAAAFIGLLTR